MTGLHDARLKIAALGGGHGLHATLSALRRLHDAQVVGDLTAIVTVADNGGSSGRLRAEFGVLPPGDLRMAVAAMCGSAEWDVTWAEVLQHRFDGDGEMSGHNLGNLMIVGLWELLGDNVAALDMVCHLVGAKGRVLPMALVPMDITAEVRGLVADDPHALTHVRGQVEVATAGHHGIIDSIALVPPDPPATPEALRAVGEADFVLLGPGSWFSSVIPHLCVPELRLALQTTRARKVLVLNLTEQEEETGGFTPADHVAVFAEHAPQVEIDHVLADVRVHDVARLKEVVEALGAELVLADVASGDGSPRHDPDKLAEALRELVTRDR